MFGWLSPFHGAFAAYTIVALSYVADVSIEIFDSFMARERGSEGVRGGAVPVVSP